MTYAAHGTSKVGLMVMISMTSGTILSVVLIVLVIAHPARAVPMPPGSGCNNGQPSTRPLFSNVPGTKIIQDTAATGDVVYQVYCVQNAAAMQPVTLDIMNSVPFNIKNGPPDGTILVNGALTAGLYAVDILCCDDQGYDLQTLYVHCRMAPTFLNIPTTISISETTPIQTSIFAVQASNNGYAGTSWTYLIVPTSNTFQIDPLTGVVSLIQLTDYEAVPNTHSLVITATDNNNFVRTSTLTVSITDVCGQPIFQGTPYVANIVEGSYSSAIFFQTSQYNEEKSITPTISITSMVPANTIFSVASGSTGTIQYSSPTFNQDTTPQYLINLQLSISSAFCGTLTDTAVLAVNILEKDPPVLTASGSTTVTISEQLPGGTNVAGFSLTYDDPVSLASTKLTLCCTPYDAYFTINTAGTAIVAGSPLLYYADMYSITGSPVSFPLTLIATLTRADGKSLVTKLPYTIIVTEIQIAPVFNPSMGYVTVPEQQPPGTVVNNFFSATDDNVNKALTYSMVPSTGSSNFNFVTTPQPHLTTAVTFTYQGLSPSQWIFTFTAVDVSSKTATYTMTVSVVPINNIPKYVPSTGTISIVENQATGLSVFQFSCTDLNTADTLTYSIIQSTYSQNFVIVNHSPTGDLLTNWVFDYYTMPQTTFTIQVMCTTTGHLFDIFTLTVKITPIAWPPYFDPSTGSGTVKEQLPAGTDINTYFPCKNKNPADTYTYAITPTVNPLDSTYFQIALSPSPHLKTTTVFNYFSMPYTIFTLEITAVDQNTLTASYTITVSVLPVNQPPGFNPTSGTISINERQTIGTEVPYNFTATKQNPTDVLTYSIIPSAYSEYFTLQPTPAAHLLTNTVFDYDTMIPSTHTVIVYIKCLSSSGLSSVFTLTVNILRIDKPPVLSPSSTCQTTLNEKLPIGTTVNCFFTATDPQGASLTYTLVPSTDSPNFNLILGTTNTFTTAVSFTYNTMPHTLQLLTVNVSDSVGQSTLYTVQVQVLQVNTAPTFTPAIGTANVPEGQAAGYVVTTYFPAVDAQNDIVSYYLEPAPCSDYFAVAPTPSPHLVTIKVIDIDTVPTTTPTFFIRGQDPAGLYTKFQLDITITPIQHVPVCLPATCQTNINEDVPLGSPLSSCVMTATDPDNDPLVFTLGATPTYPGKFALNTGTATTRMLVTSTLFDYYTMTQTVFTYIVTATDSASNACSFTVTVTINPVPHAPVFNPITCSDTIPSNQPAGLAVSGCTFQATDVNTGDSISYSIVTAQYSNLFTVQTSPSPHLVTTQLIDYPTLYPTTSITVTIMAKDTSGLSATFTEIVTLTQTNLPPSFNPNTCSVNVAEYQPINSVVNCYFSATDRNIGDSVTYSMPASTYFNLVTTSGKPHLTTAQVFNYYTLSQFVFTQVITATDMAGATDNFTVTISITYVRIAPYFLLPSETVSYGDGQPVNTIIPLNMTTYFDMMDTVTYSIVPSQYSSYFKLSSTTGSPFVLQAKNFDYYQMGNPSLTIQAEVLSSYTGQLGLKLITVNVYPVNTAPKLNVTSGSVSIDEMLPIGTWVPFGFTATDREGGPLNYSISSTDAPGYFALNTLYPTATNPARLLVNNTIDYDSPTLVNPIHLVITVTDNGTLTNSLSLTITILPTYKLPPVFTNSSCNATILGNSLVATSLFTLSATDPNVNMPTPPIRYTLTSITTIPNKYFTVDIQSGGATVGYPIPNVAAEYVLNATTYNRLKPYLSSSRLCYVTTTVTIVTTTTQAPAVYNSSFTMAFYNFEIRADANIGDYAGTVKAIRDGTSPMPIQYYMTSGSTYTTVGISSGWLKLAQYVTADQEYIQYCSCIDTGTKDGLLSCIQFRLDVYSASQYLVNITVNKPTADFTPAVLQDFMTKLTSAIRAQLPDAYPRLVYLDGYTVALDGTITSPTTVPNLQTTNITIVILKGTYTDNIANITNAKQYYYATDVLPSVLDTNGQPNSGFSTMKTKYPITKIVPYKYQTVPAKAVNWWLDTTPGLITVGGLCLLGLLGITAAIAAPAALACRKSGAENALRNANKGRPAHNYTEAPEPEKPARTWDDPEPRPPTYKPNSVPPTRQEMPREPSRRSQLTDVDYDSRPSSMASADNVSLYLRDSNSRFAMPSCRYVNRLH